MSFFGGAHMQATEAPKVANLDASDTSSNEEGVPVAWGIGRCKRALHWLSAQPFKFRQEPILTTSGSGKGAHTSVTGFRSYGDVPASAGLGLARRIVKIVAANTTVWEGSVVRSDDPGSPDYWRAHIATERGDAYVYWGRDDQPVDDILLAGLAEADDDQWHPAYRGEVLVILKDWYFGDNISTAPNMVLHIDVEPTPAVGTFPPQGSAQGESIVAGIAALASHPIYGAGFPADMFVADELEQLSADVIADCGCHSPFLDRAQPLRDVITDLMLYYGGWARIQEGKIRFGRWPHNGTVPAGLTELSDHDFTERPQTTAGSPSTTINEVTVTCRDASDALKEKPVVDSASDNVEARKGHEGAKLTMLGFVDLNQARVWVNKAASTGAEGKYSGSGKLRQPRAVWASGDDLRAGDNFSLDLAADEVDQVCRITRRTDPFLGPVDIDFLAEPGVFPTPYVPPTNQRPDRDTAATPDEIAQARIWEVSPAIYGSAIGLPIAVLAKRPSATGDATGFVTNSVLGFNIHHSATGASYDVLGSSSFWAVRGTLRTALAADGADTVVQVALDGVNLDRSRITAQSAQARADDTLLILIGDELFSGGALSIAALDYDFTCARARRDTLAAAHAAGAECWIFYRREVRCFIHGAFVEDANRYFKLQPYTTKARELADCTALVYHFRDRAPEAPIIVLTTVPGSGVVGVTARVAGTISDVNGDLTSYEVQAVLFDGADELSVITLLSGAPKPNEKALLNFRTSFAFPQSGSWKIRARAADETGAFREQLSAAVAVSLGDGLYGPDDGVTPTGIDLAHVTLIPGLKMIYVQWENSTVTPLVRTRVYVSTTNVRPALPTYYEDAPKFFVFAQGLADATQYYFWFEEEGKNRRRSPITGPLTATVRAGITLGDIAPGQTIPGVGVALPNPVGYAGSPFYFNYTDGKIYRYVGGAWTPGVPTGDLIGQIDGTYQVAVNSLVAGLFAAASVTAYAVGSNLIVTDTANIGTEVVNSSHILNLVAEKIDSGDQTAMTMIASKTATDTVYFHVADRTRTMPATAFADNENGTIVNGLHSSPLERSLVSFGGWLAGAVGHVENRFGKPTMRFQCNENGGATVATGQWVDLKIAYRINGGSWIDVTPFFQRATDNNGCLNINGGCIISGLDGTDVIEFGVRVDAQDDVSQLNVTKLSVSAYNV